MPADMNGILNRWINVSNSFAQVLMLMIGGTFAFVLGLISALS